MGLRDLSESFLNRLTDWYNCCKITNIGLRYCQKGTGNCIIAWMGKWRNTKGNAYSYVNSCCSVGNLLILILINKLNRLTYKIPFSICDEVWEITSFVRVEDQIQLHIAHFKRMISKIPLFSYQTHLNYNEWNFTIHSNNYIKQNNLKRTGFHYHVWGKFEIS